MEDGTVRYLLVFQRFSCGTILKSFVNNEFHYLIRLDSLIYIIQKENLSDVSPDK